MSTKTPSIKTLIRTDLTVDVQVTDIILTRFIHDEVAKVGLTRVFIDHYCDVESL